MNIKNRLIIILVGMCIASFEAFAGPAFPLPFKAKNVDGKEINVRLVGDEHFHYYLNIDTNEKMLSRNDGLLLTATEAQLSELQSQGEKYRTMANEQRSKRMNKRMAMRRSTEDATHGKKRGLVILVNYTDVKMGSTHGQERWYRQFNEEGYSNNGHIGSVRDYFIDQSYGQLSIDFDVVGPYTLSKERAYYGSAQDAYSGGHDAHPCEMVAEACWLAADDVDFSNYDWNNDGEVDQVFVIYAGGGEHAGAGSDCIWPHEFSLSGGAWSGDGDGALHINNVRIDTYAVSCEKYLTSSSMDAIGAACHEFSHCLGLMDIYDTSYGGNHDMDEWDVLSSGSYNGSNFRGNVPCGYTAFERYMCGWLDLVELEENQKVEDMPALNDEPVAYTMTNPGAEGECFVLENRQNKRWFQYPGNAHGLMIYHIDWDNYAWWTNTMNSGDHSRVSIVPADCNYSNSSSTDYQGDLFPGYRKVTEFNDDSHVKYGGKLFNKNTDGSYFMHKFLGNITEKDGKISFVFYMPTVLNTPVLNDPEFDHEEDSYHFSWDKVKGAENYILEVKRMAPLSSCGKEPLIHEDFDAITGKGNSDGTTDVANVVSNALNSDGWSGYHIYASKQRIRLGTQIAEGYITSPLLHADSGEFTVQFSLNNVGTVENPCYLQIIDSEGVVIKQTTVLCDGTLREYSITAPENTKECYLRIYASTRAYLDDLTIYDGCWYDDSLVEGMVDLCTEDDPWQWNETRTYATESTHLYLEEVSALLGFGYYRCLLQAKATDGTLSPYSNPVFIIKKDDSSGGSQEDGISNVLYNNQEQLSVFDLQGRRTNATSKGLYIRNGKKYIK